VTAAIHTSTRFMQKVLPALFFLAPALAVGLPGRAATPENGPWLNALTTAYVLVDLQTGDLDGDGKPETAVCYRESLDNTNALSGIAILSPKGDVATPVFHVQLEPSCEKVRINGRKLGILLATKTGEKKQLVWTYGTEIKFRGQGDRLSGSAVRATTSMPGNEPAKAFDGDLSTAWAEGKAGTGIGQSITIRFPRPTDVGALAVFGGDGTGKRGYLDNNRIHRGSVEAKTEADLGDVQAGIDFKTLGIESIGDRVEFELENRPEVKYLPIHKKGVVELQLRIDSVFLGDKRDDTRVAEIEIVPMLTLAETLDAATSLKNVAKDEKKPATAAPSSGKPTAKVDDGTATRAEASLKSLDSQGGSLVDDE
jgi:hypothetical protein